MPTESIEERRKKCIETVKKNIDDPKEMERLSDWIVYAEDKLHNFENNMVDIINKFYDQGYRYGEYRGFKHKQNLNFEQQATIEKFISEFTKYILEEVI